MNSKPTVKLFSGIAKGNNSELENVMYASSNSNSPFEKVMPAVARVTWASLLNVSTVPSVGATN